MRILIINPFGIGDVIFSTPLIEVLKKEFPDSFIGYICNERASELIATNPYISKIFIYEKDEYRSTWRHSRVEGVRKVLAFLKSIKREKFDVSIDLSLGYYYSMLLRVIGIKKRLGFNYRNRGKFLTDKIDIDGFGDKHVIEYYLDILKLLNISIGKYKIAPKVYLTDIDKAWADSFLKDNNVSKENPLIGIVPGCGASWGADAKFRRWDRANFAKLCDSIIDRNNARIMLFGDSKEVGLCEDVERMMKNRAIVACGKTGLREFLGLLNRCELVVTNDGGPLHMAVSLGVKTISIFGPVNEKIYGPYPPGPRHMVISKNDVPCRPCYKKFKYNPCDNRICLNSISHDEVLKASENMLNLRT